MPILERWVRFREALPSPGFGRQRMRLTALQTYSIDGPPLNVRPEQMYEISAPVVGYTGAGHCAYFLFRVFDEAGVALRQRVRWIDTFDGRVTTYRLVVRPHVGAIRATVGWRINSELPGIGAPSDVDMAFAPPAEILLTPVAGHDEDYSPAWLDYLREWQIADLEKDWWSIVGPGTRSLYEEVGRAHFEQLLAVGLTPGSAVLDVGCGTGMLAQQLVKYMESGGRYVGTEIATEAVAFCRKRYAPPFDFIETSFTDLPLGIAQFDIITFHSIFTHTYPNETLKLLYEARRLLKADGVVLADIFICPTTPHFTGTRSKIEVNENLFRAQAAEAGFSKVVMMAGGAGQQSPFVLRP